MKKPNANTVKVEVVFASPTRQEVVEIELPVNSTARQAVTESGLANLFTEVDFESAPIGVYGKIVPDDHILNAYDRVEVYRPLHQTPTDARRKRVKAASRKSGS